MSDPVTPAQGPSIRLGISTCLLGERVRYDGGHKLDRYLVHTLGRYVEWVPVCPETEMGLSVPREAMRLVGDPDYPRLVTVQTGVDHTCDLIPTPVPPDACGNITVELGLHSDQQVRAADHGIELGWPF